MKNVSDKGLEHMWREFGDIAIDEDEKIITDFYDWKSGTDRFKIWHWFDEMHTKGLAKGLMYKEK